MVGDFDLILVFPCWGLYGKITCMNRTGFTLIELLVVIGVIIVLAGVVIPALQTAKQHTRAVVCGSNMKQLCMALVVYDQENGTFPHGFDASGLPDDLPPGGCPGNAADDFQGWWWFHFLGDSITELLDEGGVAWCPSRTVQDHYVLCGNYGVNRAICKDSWSSVVNEFMGRPLGSSQIRHPSLTLLVADSGYSLISWRGAAQIPGPYYENPRRDGAFYVPGLRINSTRQILAEFEDDAIKGRHMRRSINAGFTDGHVERIQANSLLVEMVNGAYANRSSLWLPE